MAQEATLVRAGALKCSASHLSNSPRGLACKARVRSPTRPTSSRSAGSSPGMNRFAHSAALVTANDGGLDTWRSRRGRRHSHCLGQQVIELLRVGLGHFRPRHPVAEL